MKQSNHSHLKNIYHMNVSLYILDVVRMFQDHPKYANGIRRRDLVEFLEQEKFSDGDIDSQIKTAIGNLQALGFLRNTNNGFKTLGPYARLADAKTTKEKFKAWEKLQKMI